MVVVSSGKVVVERNGEEIRWEREGSLPLFGAYLHGFL